MQMSIEQSSKKGFPTSAVSNEQQKKILTRKFWHEVLMDLNGVALKKEIGLIKMMIALVN